MYPLISVFIIVVGALLLVFANKIIKNNKVNRIGIKVVGGILIIVGLLLLYKAFPGRFWGGRYVFPSAPVFAEILSTSKQQDFGTFCPEVPAERRTYA